MFQGQVKIVGAGADTYDEYNFTLNTFFGQDALAEIKNFSYTISDTLYGQISIKKNEAIPLEDLYVKYVLVEEVSSVVNIYSHKYCEQVAIAKGMKFIGDEDFSNPISFKLGLPSTVPDDIVLYIWLQILEDPYNADTCKIYNVIEEDILLGKGGIQ